MAARTQIYSWDDAKAQANLIKHGVDFRSIVDFDWHHALVGSDLRHLEPRLTAYGVISGRLHFLVYTVETRVIRVISLRKANSKEVERYAANG